MTDGERSILIVVPRNGHETCRSLSHTFADDSTVQVIVDRRLGNRRARADTHRPERRQGERRIRPDADAELRVDRWIAVPRADPGVFPCPLCGSDLSQVVSAHAQVCSYWVDRRAAAKRPLTRVGVHEPPAQAATG